MATYSVPGQNLSYAIPDDGQVFINGNSGVGYLDSVYTRQGSNVYQISPQEYARQILQQNGINLNQLNSVSADVLGIGANGTSGATYNQGGLADMYNKAKSLGLNFTVDNQSGWYGSSGYAGTGSYGTNTLADFGQSLIEKELGMEAGSLRKLPGFNLADVNQAFTSMGGKVSTSSDINLLRSIVNAQRAGETVSLTPNAQNPNAAVLTSDKAGTIFDPVATGQAPAYSQPGALNPTTMQTLVNPNAAFQNNVTQPAAATPGAQPVGYQTPEQIAAASKAAGVTPVPQGTPVPNTQATSSQSQPNDITALLSLPDLAPGAQGQEVLTLQNWLVAHGFLSGTDLATGPGTYGPKTQAAVAAWQTASNIDTAGNPGYFGPRSKAFLQQQIMSGAQTAQPGQPGTPGGTPSGGGDAPSGDGGMGDGAGDGMGGVDLADISNQIRKLYGLPEAGSGKTITQQAIDDYQSIYTALGIPTIKEAYTNSQKDFTDIQNELNDKVADINEDPWLSEGVRVARIGKLQDRYEAKLNTATSKMNFYKSLIDQGEAQARDIMGEIHHAQSDTITAVNQAIDIAQKQVDASNALRLADAKTSMSDIYGTGMIGEYNFAKANGYTGSFIQYQNEDANRKKTSTSITVTSPAASDAGSKLVAAEGPDGYTDPNLYASLRANSKLSATDFDNRFGYLVNPESRVRLGLKSASAFDSL